MFTGKLSCALWAIDPIAACAKMSYRNVPTA